jgi:spore germination cell wall hydrolase CwlJ-like protein
VTSPAQAAEARLDTTSFIADADGSTSLAPASSLVPPGEAHPSLSLRALVAHVKADAVQADSETVCLAKVVHHEASNQSLEGQLAVAQLIINRLKSPEFPKTICSVVNQRGQFFETASYRTPASSSLWKVSVAIARIAREGVMPEVAPGALFYHAYYVQPGWSHRMVRVAKIGDHIFYR